MEFLTRLEDFDISKWILINEFGHPALLSAHAIGMALVVGIVLMLDLRVLGYAQGIRLQSFRQLVVLAWVGFALNAASGVLMFMAYATTLVANWTFILKIAMIIAGGISVWFLWRAIDAAGDNEQPVFDRRAKTLAAVTALFWIGAIVAGRFIAYTLPEGS